MIDVRIGQMYLLEPKVSFIYILVFANFVFLFCFGFFLASHSVKGLKVAYTYFYCEYSALIK